MIKSFANRETKKIWDSEFSSKLPNEIRKVAKRKLRMLNNPQTINDMRTPPSNRLEKLKGDIKGYYSIRINKQWRITFELVNQNAVNVKIEDYHD